MCGIVGVHHLENANYTDVVKKMISKIAHRGPDANQVLSFDELTLGHHRLSIIDTSDQANQPFQSEDGRYTLAFNGAIYNYKELKAQLFNYSFKTESDTEVLLAALTTWGKEALNKLNGMFAFAFWDNKTKELWLARDRFGIKPMYFAGKAKEIVFASEVRAILNSDIIPRKLNQKALNFYLQYQSVLSPETLVEGVKSVEPGHLIKINSDEVVDEQWYSMVPQLHQHDGDINKTVRTLVTESVQLRMRADVPVGLFLSAGIDSSLLGGIIRKELDLPLETLTVGFNELNYSEAKESESYARNIGANHTAITLQAEELLHNLPTIASQFDHPSGDGINTYVVSKEAQKQGLKVALTGLGSDELFAGYPHFKHMQYLQQQKWLLSFPKFIRRAFANAKYKQTGNISDLKKAELITADYYDMEYAYPNMRKLFPNNWWSDLINQKASNPLFDRLLNQTKFNGLMFKWPFLSKISWAEFQSYLEPILLKDADQMSMAHGLELRTPFLDHRLVETVLSVGDSYKTGASSKHMLVNAFEDILPKTLVERKKTGFTFPWNDWLRGELKTWTEERILKFADQPFINGERMQSIWQTFLNHPEKVNAGRIWHIAMLQHWTEEHQLEI